jgi:hypothetical protein
VQDLERYLADEGPFDGLFAFSQGTSVASAAILEQQRGTSRTAHPPIKCAVFFCGRPPYTDAHDLEGSVEAQDQIPFAMADGEIIEVPTAHIWGRNDKVEPGKASLLVEMCDNSNRFELAHDGGHEPPSARDKNALTDSVHAINRMLRLV